MLWRDFFTLAVDMLCLPPTRPWKQKMRWMTHKIQPKVSPIFSFCNPLTFSAFPRPSKLPNFLTFLDLQTSIFSYQLAITRLWTKSPLLEILIYISYISYLDKALRSYSCSLAYRWLKWLSRLATRKITKLFSRIFWLLQVALNFMT